MVLLIRVLAEGKFYLGKYWTFFPGDLFLTANAYCISAIIREGRFPKDKWYRKWPFQTITGVTGFVGFIFVHILNTKSANPAIQEFANKASQDYHDTLAFGLICFLTGSTSPLLIYSKGPRWARICGIACLSIFLGCFIYDTWFNKNPDPFKWTILR